jgi:translation initiation factor 2 beta subunit (eIF-2beta)/eIF-5
MKIIEEELLSEIKQGKAIEEQHGDHILKFHDTLTMCKILNSTRTTDRAQEEVLRQEEEEGEEDPQKSRTTIQEILTFTVDIMEEAIAPKRA